MNPVADVFNYAGINLHEECLNKIINFQKIGEYSVHVNKTLLSVSVLSWGLEDQHFVDSLFFATFSWKQLKFSLPKTIISLPNKSLFLQTLQTKGSLNADWC